MSIPHASLTSQLAAEFPSIEPSDIDAYIQVAVRIVSRDTAMVKRVDITFVVDTVEYALPDDYLQCIRWSNPSTYPVNTEPPQDTDIRATTLYVYNDLSLWTDLTWTLHYGAAHVINGAGEYPNMTSEVADLVLIKAKSLVLQDMIDNANERGGVTGYDQGEVSVRFEDGTKTVTQVQGQIDSYERRYERCLKYYQGMR
jgi:hypothetical protein